MYDSGGRWARVIAMGNRIGFGWAGQCVSKSRAGEVATDPNNLEQPSRVYYTDES